MSSMAFGGAGSAAGSTTPYTTPIPGVDQYGGANLNAHVAYQKALNQVNQQRNGLLRQYGYKGSIDPNTGTVSNVSVDPLNQYGGLQQMLRGQAQQDQGAVDNNVARGLQGGLANQAETDLRYQHGQQGAQFGQGFVDSLGGLASQQDNAFTQMNNTLWEQENAAKNQAIANQDFNPADFSGVQYPTYSTDSGQNNPPVNPQNPQDPGNPTDPTDPTTSTTPPTPPGVKTTNTQRRAGLVNRVVAKKSTPGNALAARSIAMNKRYGIKPAKAALPYRGRH